MIATRILVAIALLTLAASSAFALHINEIRIDMTGTDNDEYCELAGQPGETLDDVWYIVIGDNSTARCGAIESAVDLTGLSIQPDGLLSIGDSGTAGLHTYVYDTELDLNFENSDNVTHMLVTGFWGAIDDDIDVDDDCLSDNRPWDNTLDRVGLWEGTAPDCAGTDECLYADVIVGPDGAYVPGHVFLCPEGWLIGGFDLGVNDTPGEPNDCPTPVEPSTWGGVKSIYRD